MKNKKAEENYFDMFVISADFACAASKSLLDIVSDFSDIEKKAADLHKIEHSADQHFHKLHDQLMKSFITPIDREDILLLAQKIDDVVDLIEDVANKFVMFNVKTLRSDVVDFITLVSKSCTTMKEAMEKFRNFNKSKSLTDKIHEMSDFEEAGDNFYKTAMRNLFTTETNPMEIIVWRELYDTIEAVLDASEDVANAMDSVILKNS